MLDEARRGTLPGMVRTGATFPDAAAEYMRWIEHDRARKPSTARDYHSILKAHLLPTFGEMRLEDITTEGVERWAAGLTVGGRINNRTKLKILTVLHGVMKRAKRVWKLPRNPITDVEKPVQTIGPTSTSSRPRMSWPWSALPPLKGARRAGVEGEARKKSSAYPRSRRRPSTARSRCRRHPRRRTGRRGTPQRRQRSARPLATPRRIGALARWSPARQRDCPSSFVPGMPTSPRIISETPSASAQARRSSARPRPAAHGTPPR